MCHHVSSLGEPAQTGTATLVITVTDINDNAPQLQADPVISVPQGLGAGDVVARFYISDLDTDDSGPPQLESMCNTAECAGFTLRSGSGRPRWSKDKSFVFAEKLQNVVFSATLYLGVHFPVDVFLLPTRCSRLLW